MLCFEWMEWICRAAKIEKNVWVPRLKRVWNIDEEIRENNIYEMKFIEQYISILVLELPWLLNTKA